MASGIFARIDEWCDEWVRPAIGAVYERDYEGGVQMLATARRNLDLQDFPLDESAAIKLFITRAKNYLDRMKSYPDGLEALFFEIKAAYLAIETCGPASSIMFNRVMLELHIGADRDGCYDLTEDKFHEYFDQIPPGERSSQIWYIISTWLFKTRKVELLREGYEVLLTSPSHLEQFPFRRMKLMYQLLTGTVREDDVIFYVQNLELHNAFNEFNWFLKQPIEEKGLLTPAVCEAIDQAEERFARQTPKSPFKK